MAQQTAVEWLVEQLTPAISLQQKYIDEYLEQAKATEKEQLIDFAMQMHKIDCSKTGTDILLNEAELYYNKTYN